MKQSFLASAKVAIEQESSNALRAVLSFECLVFSPGGGSSRFAFFLSQLFVLLSGVKQLFFLF
jgi:hypothetical protein